MLQSNTDDTSVEKLNLKCCVNLLGYIPTSAILLRVRCLMRVVTILINGHQIEAENTWTAKEIVDELEEE